MRRIDICGLPDSRALFHIISQTARFSKKLLHIKVCFIFIHIICPTFLILKRNERDMIKNLYWSSCKLHVILVRFEWNFNFLDRFSKNTQISNLVQIRPVRAELFHADGRTDRQTWWSQLSLFAILRTLLKLNKLLTVTFYNLIPEVRGSCSLQSVQAHLRLYLQAGRTHTVETASLDNVTSDISRVHSAVRRWLRRSRGIIFWMYLYSSIRCKTQFNCFPL
jgi:hypothetical protein